MHSALLCCRTVCIVAGGRQLDMRAAMSYACGDVMLTNAFVWQLEYSSRWGRFSRWDRVSRVCSSTFPYVRFRLDTSVSCLLPFHKIPDDRSFQ